MPNTPDGLPSLDAADFTDYYHEIPAISFSSITDIYGTGQHGIDVAPVLSRKTSMIYRHHHGFSRHRIETRRFSLFERRLRCHAASRPVLPRARRRCRAMPPDFAVFMTDVAFIMFCFRPPCLSPHIGFARHDAAFRHAAAFTFLSRILPAQIYRHHGMRLPSSAPDFRTYQPPIILIFHRRDATPSRHGNSIARRYHRASRFLGEQWHFTLLLQPIPPLLLHGGDFAITFSTFTPGRGICCIVMSD